MYYKISTIKLLIPGFYRVVSYTYIIILAARNITCGKNDRSKMKDSRMDERHAYTV